MEYGANYLHSKAEELSALYREIKPKVGRMISLCHQIEDKAYAPDLEQVRKEAYEKGFDDGRTLNTGKYEKGLNDAWEAARKINCLPSSGGIENYVLGKIFGHTSNPIIMEKFSASEAIEKIRQYEQEQEMDGLRQNIQTIVDKCGYSLDEIATVLEKMREKS